MSSNTAANRIFDGASTLSGGETVHHSPTVFACVDTSPASTKVIPHANAIADALGGALSLVHIVEPEASNAPCDPVEWDIRKRQVDLYLSGLAGRYDSGPNPIAVKVLEGRSAEQIEECTDGNAEDITAFCRSSNGARYRVGETARRIMESTHGTLLLVPATVPEVTEVKYSRILVPLDGSSRAESALPYAVRIAQKQDADIVLIHATPKLDYIAAGPQHVQDMELQEKLSKRISRLAAEYLERTRSRLSGSDVVVHCALLKSGDVRRLLEDAITTQSADLLVMSSHGQSGYSDVPTGDVSGFILCRTPIPVLMVRRPRPADADHIYSNAESKGVRRPHGSSG